jgi:hypothetical protein
MQKNVLGVSAFTPNFLFVANLWVFSDPLIWVMGESKGLKKVGLVLYYNETIIYLLSWAQLLNRVFLTNMALYTTAVLIN